MKYLIIVLALTTAVSCVSRKKYDELQTELASMTVDETFEKKSLSTAKYEKSSLNLDLNKTLIARDKEIDLLKKEVRIVRDSLEMVKANRKK